MCAAGPHTWARSFAAAAGENQSPVNIDTARAVPVAELHANLQWVASRWESAKLSNTGHGFRVDMDTDAGA